VKNQVESIETYNLLFKIWFHGCRIQGAISGMQLSFVKKRSEAVLLNAA
jgi:hypothetical protein